MRSFAALASIAAVVALFVAPLAAIPLALIGSVWEPLLPLSAGLLADTLYYSTAGGGWPIYTLLGALVTLAAYLVHGRLKASIIGR